MFKEKNFIFLFITLLALELLCSSISELNSFRYITKPLILLSLIIFFKKNNSHLDKSVQNLTLLALAFSLLGDIFLLFPDVSPHFFTLGLAAFLIAHIMYVLVFSKRAKPLFKAWFFIIVLLGYAAFLFTKLESGLGNMLIPVIIYMVVILSMAAAAFLRYNKVVKTSFTLVFIGALLFLTSDSILALNKFHKPITFANISIMLTYGLAQLLIVLGILKQKND
ncbi:lysoplasmalogenase [Mangrovimonas cancribranchiae]|uniref:Lysoplasmalogenase n=1 Tax=Mangrovimonas cancribranchiae TaxID=3080055 RepID=A0AAU6NYA1_9FLAO